jgi:glycosyltransferase involved in cell wall biosynthesis
MHLVTDLPAVSVIIAAYNAASTIADTLESIMAQTSPNWEAIVVDDGSTDATADIANSFAERDRRIRVVSRENGGESAARNAGIDHARYGWLLFLDADDWISPAHLARLTSELMAHPELDAVHCGWVRVAADGTHVADDYLAPAGDLFPVLARRAAFPVHACVVRTALVKSAGKLDPSLRTCPDWDLWQRIARMGARFGAVPEVLAYYRMTPHSSSLDAEQLFRDGLTVLRRGHAADPRVANPRAEYVDGLVEGRVETQVFYLLCWNAGLLLGAGRDAHVLLEMVRDYRYDGLYPDAIAKCIYDAATLPASQSRDAWDSLFPRIAQAIEQFLMALEAQSQTPHLGSAAFQELKKRILRNSPLWRSVIEEFEGEHERLVRQAGHWRSEKADLESEKAALERELEDVRQRQAALTFEKAAIESDRDESRTRHELAAEEMSGEIALLEQSLEETRVQADGLASEKFALEAATGPNLAADLPRPGLPEALAFQEEPHAACQCQLRVAPGNEAALRQAAGDPGTVRVEISRASSSARWDIQLNYGGLQVQAGDRYVLEFRGRSDRARTIGVGIAQAHEPWNNLGFYSEVCLTPEWQVFQLEAAITVSDGNARLHFDLGGRKIAAEISMQLSGHGSLKIR